jgi:hypothetical protein
MFKLNLPRDPLYFFTLEETVSPIYYISKLTPFAEFSAIWGFSQLKLDTIAFYCRLFGTLNSPIQFFHSRLAGGLTALTGWRCRGDKITASPRGATFLEALSCLFLFLLFSISTPPSQISPPSAMAQMPPVEPLRSSLSSPPLSRAHGRSPIDVDRPFSLSPFGGWTMLDDSVERQRFVSLRPHPLPRFSPLSPIYRRLWASASVLTMVLLAAEPAPAAQGCRVGGRGRPRAIRGV